MLRPAALPMFLGRMPGRHEPLVVSATVVLVFVLLFSVISLAAAGSDGAALVRVAPSISDTAATIAAPGATTNPTVTAHSDDRPSETGSSGALTVAISSNLTWGPLTVPQAIHFQGGVKDARATPGSPLWNFGDGSSASGTWDPTHEYIITGAFLVALIVTDSLGRTATGTYTVDVGNNSSGFWGWPDAEVSASPMVGAAGTTVSFYPPSWPGIPQDYNWSFGDGAWSSEAQPNQTFAPGTYTVRLVEVAGFYNASDDLVWSNATFEATVVALPTSAPLMVSVNSSFAYYTGNCPSDFGYADSFVSDVAGVTASMTYQWDWGDGSTSLVGGTALHDYRSGGSPYMGLTVTDASGDVATAGAPVIPPGVNPGGPECSVGPLTDGPEPSFYGLVGAEGYAILAGILSGVIAGALVVVLHLRRKKRPPAPPESSTSLGANEPPATR
jgi:PKD repeat protein